MKSVPLRAVNKKIQPTPPTAVSLHKILQPKFPLPLKQSFQQWKNRHDLESAERAVLRCVGLDPACPKDGFSVRSLNVPVEIEQKFVRPSLWERFKNKTSNSHPEAVINELEVSAPGAKNHVVLVHGYGACKGFFYRNFKDLSKGTNSTLHALDWLGYGRSTRVDAHLPRFPTRQEGIKFSEEFFLGSFENWRQKRGIEKFTLVAHSMGAYLACAYASQFPDRVEKIVLVSPASVNRTTHSIPEQELENPQLASPHIGPVPKPPSWFSWMWEQHWSPFALVRLSWFLGPKITSGWTCRRFAELPEADQHALQQYSYAMFNAKGSGEYHLNYFLACGGAGRWPLAERLSKVQCPTLWMYGDRDWMPPEGGKEAVKRLRELGRKAELEVVPDSGHHLYLDNTEVFRDLAVKFINTA